MNNSTNATAAATANNYSATLLAPVVAALAALPARPSFDDTPVGKKFASFDAETKELLAEQIKNARSNWESANLANPYELQEIAAAHLLAASVPAVELGKVIESIKARYYALNGLTALTEKEVGAALIAGKGETFDTLAALFARVKLAKEPVSVAEGVRLARLAPSSYASVNKWLAVGVQVEREEDGKKVASAVDSILAPAARKWAKSANVELVPAPKK